MMPKPSSSGLMRRINWESSPCSQVVTSTPSSIDSPVRAFTSRVTLISSGTVTSATSHLAPPTSEPPWEPQSTSNCPSSPRSGMSSRPLLTSSKYRSEVSTESTPSRLTPPTTSPTREDSVALRRTSFRTCTTASRPWLKRKNHSEQLFPELSPDYLCRLKKA